MKSAFGPFLVSLVALVGDVVCVLTGHGTQGILESVMLAGLTAGAGITIPAGAVKASAPAGQ